MADGTDCNDWFATVRGVEVTYGVFIQTVVEFLIIALGIFVIIKVFSRLQRKEKAKPKEEKVAGPSEEALLPREIRDVLAQPSRER